MTMAEGPEPSREGKQQRNGCLVHSVYFCLHTSVSLHCYKLWRQGREARLLSWKGKTAVKVNKCGSEKQGERWELG